jgi:hypothetical protein
MGGTGGVMMPAGGGDGCGAGCSSGGCGGCGAPAYRTVCVTEYRPECYTTTRTAYRNECHTETYTAYRTECTAECRTRTVTVNRMVPETHTEYRTQCVSVPCVENRTCMEAHWTCTPCTHMVTKWEDHGHYECHEEVCGPTMMDRMRKCFRKNDCCDECEPVRTRTVRCWVPCKVCVEVPVTTYERHCEMVPVTHQVTVCHTEQRQVAVQVCSYRCVPECHNETYTVMVPHQVAYQACRTVSTCVPYQETVTCTRMVPYTVEKQVPVECGGCCSAQTSCCGGHKGKGWGGGMLAGWRKGGGCCD